MWWPQSWSIRDWGSPTKYKVQWINMHSGSGGKAKIPPLLWEFHSVWCNSVDHAQSSGGWPRYESGDTLGVFDGLWSLLRHDTCLLDLHSWSSLVLSEEMNRMNTFSFTCEGVMHSPEGREGGHCHIGIKKKYPTSFLPAFSLIWLKCHQSQFLRDTILQGSISSSKRRLVCHPSVVNAHCVCTLGIFYADQRFWQFISKNSSPPPQLGAANLASGKHLLLLQKVSC